MSILFLAALVLVNGQQGRHPTQAVPVEAKLTLGSPVQIGGLAVVPIESTIPLARGEYLTLAEATKLGVIEVVEVSKGAEVNSLEVRNHGKLPVLLFAGELLLGGQQDRIVAHDSIVPGNERRDVPVFCVEHGRWDGKPQFVPADAIVPDRVRKAAIHDRDQAVVWATVAASNASVKAAPATGTLRGTLDSPMVHAASERLFGRINHDFHPSPHTIGVICWLGGKIESADIFANPNLFAHNQTKLFRSYSLDAQLESKKTVPVDMRACRAFLANVVSARRNRAESGAGLNNFEIASPQIQGIESGTGRFGGGFGGAPGGAAAATGGFSHGTYKPTGGGSYPRPK